MVHPGVSNACTAPSTNVGEGSILLLSEHAFRRQVTCKRRVAASPDYTQYPKIHNSPDTRQRQLCRSADLVVKTKTAGSSLDLHNIVQGSRNNPDKNLHRRNIQDCDLRRCTPQARGKRYTSFVLTSFCFDCQGCVFCHEPFPMTLARHCLQYITLLHAGPGPQSGTS